MSKLVSLLMVISVIPIESRPANLPSISPPNFEASPRDTSIIDFIDSVVVPSIENYLHKTIPNKACSHPDKPTWNAFNRSEMKTALTIRAARFARQCLNKLPSGMTQNEARVEVKNVLLGLKAVTNHQAQVRCNFFRDFPACRILDRKLRRMAIANVEECVAEVRCSLSLAQVYG